jgi:hypothetical protein
MRSAWSLLPKLTATSSPDQDNFVLQPVHQVGAQTVLAGLQAFLARFKPL